jgi:predicted tellurium resistance membrane protein TerC
MLVINDNLCEQFSESNSAFTAGAKKTSRLVREIDGSESILQACNRHFGFVLTEVWKFVNSITPSDCLFRFDKIVAVSLGRR